MIDAQHIYMDDQLEDDGMLRGWSEVVIENWADKDIARIPVQALYIVLGNDKKFDFPEVQLGHARAYQVDYSARTGITVPIYRFDLEKRLGKPFSYSPLDQAVAYRSTNEL